VVARSCAPRAPDRIDKTPQVGIFPGSDRLPEQGDYKGRPYIILT